MFLVKWCLNYRTPILAVSKLCKRLESKYSRCCRSCGLCCSCSSKEVIHYTNGHGYVPIKLYLQKKKPDNGQIWPMGLSLPASDLCNVIMSCKLMRQLSMFCYAMTCKNKWRKESSEQYGFVRKKYLHKNNFFVYSWTV